MDDQKNDVAIIGMSLLLPDAVSQEEFYQNLRSARDSVTGPTLDRLIYACLDPDKQFKDGGFLHRIDQFDHKFFKISKKEAEFMEPTQRLMLELACGAIENAGYSIEDFKGTDTAVYLCANPMFPITYQMKIEAEHTKPDPTIHTGTLGSMICGRVAYALGLTGPTMMIDSGCSSSLSALNEAADKIIAGSVSTALVGGIMLKVAAPEEGSRRGHLGASSKAGKSRAFDAEADGIGTGEGGGIIVLKRLDHAIRDNDNIQAVIKGIGISQDGGRCNSIAAPSPIAQTNTIRQAWKRAGVEPESISYIETHGAGTHLGDVIEVQALTDAFGSAWAGKKICALGAVKTNIGHIGNAAGMAGIIKAVISLKKKELFPCLHFKTPNPFIDFDNSPVYVNTEYKSWDKTGDHPRRCGVSSFGLSGTNGHVVLEEYEANKKTTESTTKGLFLKIAAKSSNVWTDYCNRVADYLETTTDELDNVLFTLNSGRGEYPYRTGFYAETKDELVNQLREKSTSTGSVSKQQDKEVVLLFSPGKYPQQLISQYRINQSFNTKYEEIKSTGSGFTPGSPAETLAVQLGLYAALTQMGVAVKTMVGNGIGRITTQVITGAITVQDAVNLIENDEVPETPVDDTRLKNLVADMLGSSKPLFAELGADNIFYTKLAGWKNELEGLDVTPSLQSAAIDPLLAGFTEFYNYGVTVDWKKGYAQANLTRVEAPTYPFEKIRCWYKDAIDPALTTISKCLYEEGWQVNDEPLSQNVIAGKSFLVFAADKTLSRELADRLVLDDNTCVFVQAGDQFRKHSATQYEINGASEETFNELRQSLIADGMVVDGIIHLNTYTKPVDLSVANHEELLDKSFLVQYHAAKIFADEMAVPGFYYAVLTSDATRVTGDDITLSPLHGMCGVLVKTLMAENPAMIASSLDLSWGEYEAGDIADRLIREMSHDNLLRFAAIRNKKRYTPVVQTVSVKNSTPVDLSLQSGAYLVTGGSSGIGLETCRSLAEAGSCHFFITGRTALPPVEAWEQVQEGQPVYEKIKALQALQQKGSQVSYFAAEAGDAAAMSDVFNAIKKTTNKLTGIIHAAGLGNTGTPIRQRSYADMRATLRPKITGTLLLEELSRDLSPDFCISFSSIAVLVPSKGSADYSSANAFEDAFARSMRLQGKRFIAINWADWKETGLAYRKRMQRDVKAADAREKVVRGLSNKEGILAIRFAITLDKPQLAVANTDMASFAINPFFTVVQAQPETIVAPVKNNEEDNTEKEINTEKIKTINSENLSETEAGLMMIWYETLKLDLVNLDDDFYDLGGHSLNITQMLNKVKKVFGVSLDMEEMFKYSTVRLLSARIDEYIAKGKTETYEKIVSLPEQPYYAISHAQKRFWILSQQAGSEAYNVPAAYFFTGKINIAALENAFRHIIERHESLRTSFVLVDGEPRQRVHAMSEFDFSLPCIDMTTSTGELSVLQHLLQQEAAIPFNLETPPLLRAKIFQLKDDRYLFFMNMHHIVADATSIAVIRNEVLAFYKAFANKTEVKLQPLSVHYKDFAAWQNQQLQGDKLETIRDYWKNRLLNSLPPVMLPADYQPVDKKDKQSTRNRISIEGESFEGLKKLAEKNGTSVFTITLALFNILLHKYTGMNDLVIGTPVNGRDHNDLERQVGVYLNTLLLRTTIDEASCFSDFLVKVRENTWKDLAHQLYPYDLLTDELKQQPFNIGFTWTVRESVKESADLDFEIEEMPTGFNMAKNDLWFFGAEFRDTLVVEIMYRTAVYKKETIDLLTERLNVLLAQVIESAATPIRDLHIKTTTELQMEQQQEVIEFNF